MPIYHHQSDNQKYKENIYKSYDTIASNEILSIKSTSDCIKYKSRFLIYEEVVTKVFKREYNFKITHVETIENHNYAWIVATNPKQTINIKFFIFGHECIDVLLGKPSSDDLAKKCIPSHCKEPK